jgi:hypothetical protein
LTEAHIDPALVAEGRALLARDENTAWEWGDLVLRVMPPQSPDRHLLVEWATAIGWYDTGRDITTLLSFRTTALAWPVERRCKGASFSAHYELNAAPDRFEKIRPGLSKRAARVAAGKKAEIGDKENRPAVIKGLLADPAVIAQLAEDPEALQALAQASLALSKAVEKSAKDDRRRRTPELADTEPAYLGLAHLSKAVQHLAHAVECFSEVDGLEGHRTEAMRLAVRLRDRTDMTVEFLDGLVDSDALDLALAEWAEERA